MSDLNDERRGGAHYKASLRMAVATNIGRLSGLVLDVGCGQRPYEPLVLASPSVSSYVGVDIGGSGYVGADVLWDGVRLPIRDAVAGGLLLTEVLEHCPDPHVVARECARALSPGGHLLGSVPFVWPLHDAPYDEYRYTPFALQRIFQAAGFAHVQVTALGGWDASLAQVVALWAHRRPMSPRQRRIAVGASRPLVTWLNRRDVPPTEHRDNVLATGWFIVAKRAGQ